ncbi:MAG TPA: EamA family transporter, partial [Clostridiaceae bacterium]|nr:EamA family transporter [Clostridiaceae bacterium]
VATKYTTSANAILLQYTAPVYVILLSDKILGEKVKKSEYYTVLGVLVGMIIFAFDGLTNKNLMGNIFGMMAGICFAAVILSTKKIHMSSRTASSLEPLFLGNLLTAFLCSPFYLKGNIVSGELWMLAALGIFQLGVPYVIYAYASKYLSAVQTSLITTLEPILNPVWVFLATREQPSMLSLAGGLIVIASISFNYMTV